jgi:hypothetical protein
VFAPPFEGSVKTGGMYGHGEQATARPSFSAILYRDGNLQVEHLIYPPNTEVPEHRHPDVDSLGIFLSGDIEFTLFGKSVHAWDESTKTENDTPSSLGRVVPIPNTVTHGVKIGPRGGSFLSIQLWLNEAATQRVSDNWRFKDADQAPSQAKEI